MENLISIFKKNSEKLKISTIFWKTDSRKIERNLTVSPIWTHLTAMELSSPSLSSGHVNKDKIFRKYWTKKEGGGYP